jgi:hypothetical protein
VDRRRVFRDSLIKVDSRVDHRRACKDSNKDNKAVIDVIL